MINNFEIIKPLLDFTSMDTYYFLQILKRRKDNLDMDKDMIVIEDLFIYNMSQFERMEEDVIKTCKAHNARAYLRLNRRSMKKTAMQMLKRVTDLIISENYKAVKNAYSSISGEFHGDEDKSWVLDFDFKDFESRKKLLGVLHKRIEELQIETGRDARMDVIPTKNGYHLITRPFNIHKMEIMLNDLNVRIDCHKDNPTILYCP